MSTLAVVTPSFGPDLDLCDDLHRSVLRATPTDVVHYLVVPDRDVGRFAHLEGPRCVLWRESRLLSPRLVALPGLDAALRRLGSRRTLGTFNVRRPFLPVRGWVLQQVVKLAAVAAIEADVVLLADSDVRLVRPVGVERFVDVGVVRLYRQPGGVDVRLERHLAWHRAARRLLGLPDRPPPLPDYVSSFTAWDRRIVLALLERLEQVSGRHWLDTLSTCLDWSEWTLYGVFVDEVLGPPANTNCSDEALCHSYWDRGPLGGADLEAFMAGVAPDDVAVLIQSKSLTPLDARRGALDAFPLSSDAPGHAR